MENLAAHESQIVSNNPWPFPGPGFIVPGLNGKPLTGPHNAFQGPVSGVVRFGQKLRLCICEDPSQIYVQSMTARTGAGLMVRRRSVACVAESGNQDAKLQNKGALKCQSEFLEERYVEYGLSELICGNALYWYYAKKTIRHTTVTSGGVDLVWERCMITIEYLQKWIICFPFYVVCITKPGNQIVRW